MLPDFFDIHSHLNDTQFEGDIVGVVERMRKGNVWTIVVGTDRRSSQIAAQISCFYGNIFSAIGVHPTDNTNEYFNEDYFSDLLACESVVAVGECGLDTFRAKEWNDKERTRQRELFERQLEFAVAIDKPLMIHCRNAHEEMLDILSAKNKVYGDKLRGNIHFFAGDVSTAKRYFELGFTVSFTGVITFARDYDEVVRYAPLDMILSETDSPYVAPVPYRGKRNEPSYVAEVVRTIAEIRGVDFEIVRRAMVDNALRVFNIKV